ncbi:MAG: hypothetical protein RLZZ127_3235 [Planctomycetota bacterium]
MRRLPYLTTAILIALAACAPRPEPQALVYDRPAAPRWTIDSADDWAEAAGDPLEVRIPGGARGGVLLRCEVDDDLRPVRRLVLPVLAAEGPLAIALGWRTADGALAFGPATDLATGPATAAWTVADLPRERIERLLVKITAPGRAAGRVVLGPLLVDGAPVRRAEPPRLLGLEPAPALLVPRALWTVTATLAHAPDRGDGPVVEAGPALRALVTGPDGRTRTLPGFPLTRSASGSEVVTVAAFRVRPDQPGTWTVQPIAGAGRAEAVLPALTTVVAGAPAASAAILVDRRDPRWFADADGGFFYPVGANVAWSGDYGPYFSALAAHGGTWTRVWLAPWNHPLHPGGRFVGVDPAATAAVDAMLAEADRHGLRVQLVLMHHGMLGSEWGRSPFNAANGGPCTDPREFWVRGDARDLFRRVLDAAVARWAHHPALMGWELVNEADLCPRWRDEDVREWHRAMADHLRRRDPGRLVFTSSAGPDALPGLDTVPGLLLQVHGYHPDLSAMLVRAEARGGPDRPMLLAEYGRGWQAWDEATDPEGRLLHRSLWRGWMHGLAGAPAPWWWDTHLEPRGLWARFAPFARFIAGQDRRGVHAVRVALPEADGLAAEALVAADRAWCYAWNPEWERTPRAAAAPLVAGTALTLDGLAPGTWDLVWWNGERGATVATQAVRVGDDQRAVLALPAGLDHDGMAVLRRHTTAPVLGRP